ncbi:MAG TPA: aminotransferase class V-fold PLP-dependent enzyme [Chloroflexia bacterium]|nr:aminotransferase class V-fold PLP-dependent enzyme [Chloroflexia bacterium]
MNIHSNGTTSSNGLPQRSVYLDHAATTSVHPDVLDAMLPYFTERYGNPSSVHAWGRAAHQGLEGARRQVASVLGCRPREVVFTSGGTEADNFAMKGVAWAYRRGLFPNKQPSEGPGHIITSAIEHHTVLHSAEDLEKHGFEVTVLPVDQFGRVSPEAVARAMRPDTVLVSIMAANNEIGTIQPIAEIAAIAHEHGALFHTDAVQAGAYLDIDAAKLGADLLSLSAHKFYGPKGVGVLYIKANTPILPIQHGGSQEARRRASTENVPGIVGLGAALTRTHQNLASEVSYVKGLRDRLVAGILQKVPDVHQMGHPTERLPNNANFCIEGVEGETMLLKLDMRGIGASSGAACASGSTEPSHVLRALGIPRELAQGSLRLTVGIDNSPGDIEYALDVLTACVAELRSGNRTMVGTEFGN